MDNRWVRLHSGAHHFSGPSTCPLVDMFGSVSDAKYLGGSQPSGSTPVFRFRGFGVSISRRSNLPVLSRGNEPGIPLKDTSLVCLGPPVPFLTPFLVGRETPY